MRSQKFKNYEIMIEGSSSAAGYSDESGKGGFSGRIDNHFRKYGQELKREKNWGTIDHWVYVQNFARVGRLLPAWVDLVDDHIREANHTCRQTRTEKVLGIFVLEAHPLRISQKYGNDFMHVWRDSLEKIELICGNGGTEPLFVQMPMPPRNVGQKGHAIHAALVEHTRKTAHSLDADVIDVASMPGIDLSLHTAEDGLHPDAAGHELIFKNLLPIIYQKLGLEPHN